MNFKNIFKRKFRTYVLDQKYRVEQAFECGGKTYFMFSDPNDAPTGRMMAALAIYNEMEMRCDREYLTAFCKAMDKLLSDPKRIQIKYIAQLVMHMQERLELMPMPEFIYKLASVVYFDDSESPYMYDYTYAEKKIKFWKDSGADLGFFLNSPMKRLIPSLALPLENLSMFSQMTEKIDAIHRARLSDILSDRELMPETGK